MRCAVTVIGNGAHDARRVDTAGAAMIGVSHRERVDPASADAPVPTSVWWMDEVGVVAHRRRCAPLSYHICIPDGEGPSSQHQFKGSRCPND